MKTKDVIKQWEAGCETVATAFVKKYFGKAETYWVSECVGDVFVISEDYFFNVGTMVDYIKYGYGKEKMFKRYHEELETLDKKGTLDGFPNIKSWTKLKTK